MKHLAVLYAVLCMATFLSVTQTVQAKSHKNADSSTLETPPIYGLEGTLGSDVLGDYHQSVTTADGNLYSAWCDTTSTSVHCEEGTPVVNFVKTTDGRRIVYGCDRCLAVDLDHSDGFLGFAPVEPSDAPLPFNLKDGTVIHFRLRHIIPTQRVVFQRFVGSPEDYLCVPVLHLPEFPDGKARAKYAKHHSMESCIMYTP